MEGVMIKNVSKAYGSKNSKKAQVLCNINLKLNKGECISLIGDSGSGKSTLGRIILGVEQPTSGMIAVDGVDASGWGFREWRKHRRVIQGVFQDTSGTLNPRMSTYRNMEEGLRNLTTLNHAKRRMEIYQLMERMGIDKHLLKVPTRMLSGGEQRRISLLRALAVKPKYLVLDEVISGLDLICCDAVLATLEDYRNAFGCAYLLITHDMHSAYRISDRIVVMQNGKLCREAVKK